MKIKKLLLALSLAGCCLGTTGFAEDGKSRRMPKSISDNFALQTDQVRTIGDGAAAYDTRVKSVGDAATYTGPVPAVARQASRSVGDGGIIAPTALASANVSGSACDLSSAGCDLAACAPRKNWTWFGAETLLWFGQKQDSPPLITTAPQTVIPIAGNPGVTTRFGGQEGIDFGLLPGYRISAGIYLDDCQKFALGGRAYGIYPGKSVFAIASSGGEPSVGIPFFNADPSVMAEAAELIAYHDGTQLYWAGEARARSDIDMFGSDGSLHMLLARSNDHRVDMLAGYTYNKLKSSIDLRTTRTNFFTGDMIPDGTIFRTTDLFETENEFNGAHLGILSSVVRCRLTLSTLAKVSFGNMHQSGVTNGSTEQEDPNSTVTSSAGGIFTKPSNIGSFSRDRFAFIPELGVKAAYEVCPGVQLTTGYTFMYWSSVALAGEQIDRMVDPSGSTGLPAATNAIGSYWMQGVDLGLNITF